MELLRDVVVLVHLVGSAVTFGAWVAEAAAGPFRTTRVLDLGLLVSLPPGLALAAPRPAGSALTYPKTGVTTGPPIILRTPVGLGTAPPPRPGGGGVTVCGLGGCGKKSSFLNDFGDIFDLLHFCCLFDVLGGFSRFSALF